MRIIITYLLVLFIAPLFAQGYFEITEDIELAYQQASSLQFDEARATIAHIERTDPENKLVYHIENYIDFFTLFINENEEDYERLKANKDTRLKKISEGDKESPYYLFCKAEINLQWATIRLKFGEEFTPLREIYRAYKLLEKNDEKFPDFIENKKSLSIIHALGESLPGMLQTIMGIDGSIDLGTREIHDVVDYTKYNDFLFKDEAYAIYAYILFYQNNKKEEAYQLLFDNDLDHSNSPLLCFLKANIAQKTGHTEEAIAILESRPRGDDHYPFLYLEFMYGKFKLYNLDPSAKDHMLAFIETFEGRHFIKEAYQKLAWYELATNENLVAYKKYMDLCQSEGNAMVDEDKQALKESKEKKIPNISLLKARLLFDGGYYTKAYNLLVRKSYEFAAEGPHKLEYLYRMGRVTQELDNYHDAIAYYDDVIAKGKKQKSFMACNAALQTALIYEEQAQYSKAKNYFDTCLDISPSEYKRSLHQKAKSGLDRLKYKGQ